MVRDLGSSFVTIKVISEMGENGWYRSNIPIVITNESDKIDSIHYRINGEPFEYTEPFNVTNDGNDIEFKWYAVDHEGNKSEWDGPFYFDLDKTKPNVPEAIAYETFKVNEEVGSAGDYISVVVREKKLCPLYAGRVVEYAGVKELFRNPLHPYTQGLLNSLPRVDRDDTKKERLLRFRKDFLQKGKEDFLLW
jgi:hypothetical protein